MCVVKAETGVIEVEEEMELKCTVIAGDLPHGDLTMREEVVLGGASGTVVRELNKEQLGWSWWRTGERS